MRRAIVCLFLMTTASVVLANSPIYLKKHEKLIDNLSYEMNLASIPELNTITIDEFKSPAFPFKNSPTYLDGYSADMLFSMTEKNVPFTDIQLIEMSGFCSAVFGAQSAKRKNRIAMPIQALACVAIRNNKGLRSKRIIAKRTINDIRYRYDFEQNIFVRINE